MQGQTTANEMAVNTDFTPFDRTKTMTSIGGTPEERNPTNMTNMRDFDLDTPAEGRPPE